MIHNDAKSLYSSWFSKARYNIIDAIENIEKININNMLFHNNTLNDGIEDNTKFNIKPWVRDAGGGGEIGILRGRVFEKGGVNFSCVYGDIDDKFKTQLPWANSDTHFWASGVSVVMHPRSPFIPPIHMNTRCIATNSKSWFGACIDLNPIYIDDEETRLFHHQLQVLCRDYGMNYNNLAQECDKYFWLKHRNEPRGVGGIFLDYHFIDNDNAAASFEFIQSISETFCEIYPSIVAKKSDKAWNDDDRNYQLMRRGRYAEFNLLYDRGIKFGLATGGNIEGMMMSMPPLASW